MIFETPHFEAVNQAIALGSNRTQGCWTSSNLIGYNNLSHVESKSQTSQLAPLRYHLVSLVWT